MQNTLKYKGLILLAAVIGFTGCRKVFDLPEELDYLSPRADYTNKIYDWRLGRTTVYNGAFNSDNSNFPMTFEIRNPRFGDGRDASDMLVPKPVLVWTSEYSGQETSLAQIEAKRKTENRPMLELRGNGDIVLWNSATPKDIKPLDSAERRFAQDYRYFDVKITNSGGSRIIKDLRVDPLINMPYWPDDDYNNITGKPNTMSNTDRRLKYNTASISGVKGPNNQDFENNLDRPAQGLLRVYIRRFSDDPNGNRLRVKFLDKDSVAMNPGLFNETKWDNQVHGFNEAGTALGHVLTEQYVEYKVAYPIPLVRLPTRYTAGGLAGNGENGRLEFLYSRTGSGGVRETGRITRDFKIYEKGDWEIVFHFKFVTPKFENE